MQIHDAIRLVREVCARRHFSINTEKTYIYWLGRYGVFLKDPKLKMLTSEGKMEAFLTGLAMTGYAAATQNQAFNALLVWRNLWRNKRRWPGGWPKPTGSTGFSWLCRGCWGRNGAR